ncbi:MAG: hypothetical protein ACOC56_06225 [Atribacterota bacterium]
MSKKDNKRKVIKNKNSVPDHIDEYFKDIEGSKEAIQSRELFKADNNDIDLKTDLTNEEISHISILKFNDEFLKSKGIKPVFMNFFYNYMRLKVSKDRQSRGEFVKMNRKDDSEDILSSASNLKNLMDSKK